VDGPERGAVAGFAAGLAVDLLVTTPFGLTALAYSLVGFVVGTVQHGVLRPSVALPLASAVLGAGLGVAVWVLAATVVGKEGLLEQQLLVIAAVVAVSAGVLVMPAVRLVRWVDGEAGDAGGFGGERRGRRRRRDGWR